MLAASAGSNPARSLNLSRVTAVCCQVEVSTTGWSLVQRSTECGVSEFDREASTMRRPWPTRDCCVVGGTGWTSLQTELYKICCHSKRSKVKVKYTLYQATKAQRWSRGIALLFL